MSEKNNNIFYSIGLLAVSLFSLHTYMKIKKIEKHHQQINDDSETNDRLDTYETRVTLLEKKVSTMASHEKRISSLGQRVSDMTDYGQRLFQVEHQERHHGETMANISKRMDDAEKYIEDHDISIKNQNERLQRIEMEKPVYTFLDGNTGTINGVH